jgi:hypothetical protein
MELSGIEPSKRSWDPEVRYVGVHVIHYHVSLATLVSPRSFAGSQRYSVAIETPRVEATSRGGTPFAEAALQPPPLTSRPSSRPTTSVMAEASASG